MRWVRTRPRRCTSSSTGAWSFKNESVRLIDRRSCRWSVGGSAKAGSGLSVSNEYGNAVRTALRTFSAFVDFAHSFVSLCLMFAWWTGEHGTVPAATCHFLVCSLSVSARTIPRIRAHHTRKLSQMKWILRDRSMFLLAEASPSRSLGHRQKRSLTDSFSPVVAAPWCAVAVPNTVLFRVHV